LHPGDVVGYAVRLDSRQSRSTRLLFCTTGVLLQQLKTDPTLAQVSHVVVDEVSHTAREGGSLKNRRVNSSAFKYRR
jgi:ATP-dependent RNA helicase DHX57